MKGRKNFKSNPMKVIAIRRVVIEVIKVLIIMGFEDK
jgi:hypothetical protein